MNPYAPLESQESLSEGKKLNIYSWLFLFGFIFAMLIIGVIQNFWAWIFTYWFGIGSGFRYLFIIPHLITVIPVLYLYFIKIMDPLKDKSLNIKIHNKKVEEGYYNND